MLITVPTRDCRLALEAAEKYVVTKRDEDKATAEQQCYERLYNGARHNGMTPSLDHMQQMREMAARDIEHMMTQHPSAELLGQIAIYKRMLELHERTGDDEIILDAVSFELLGGYLPSQVTTEKVDGDNQSEAAA